MFPVIEGVIAGKLAGILMAAVSEACFRLGIFRSSLVLVDGEFLFRTLNIRPGNLFRYVAGTIIHVVTSGVFGGIYMAATTLFGLNSLSPALVTAYYFLLWLSMLFIALPVAGQGLLGKKAGAATWFEQLILHIIFGAGYYLGLKMFAG